MERVGQLRKARSVLITLRSGPLLKGLARVFGLCFSGRLRRSRWEWISISLFPSAIAACNSAGLFTTVTSAGNSCTPCDSLEAPPPGNVVLCAAWGSWECGGGASPVPMRPRCPCVSGFAAVSPALDRLKGFSSGAGEVDPRLELGDAMLGDKSCWMCLEACTWSAAQSATSLRVLAWLKVRARLWIQLFRQSRLLISASCRDCTDHSQLRRAAGLGLMGPRTLLPQIAAPPIRWELIQARESVQAHRPD